MILTKVHCAVQKKQKKENIFGYSLEQQINKKKTPRRKIFQLLRRN